MSDAYAYSVTQTGGPEVLRAEPIDVARPAPGEVLVRHEAVGLNYIDVYNRSGLYPLPLPSGLGAEAAGVIEAVGEGVDALREGDRIGYFTGPLGAYASHRTIVAEKVVKLPSGIEPDIAAAAMLKGCTAEFLVERCAKVQRGDAVLVHAAAGGVGSILIRWLKTVGATVIAHAGTSAKADIAESLGADHALSCPMDQLAGKVRALTEGRGVQHVLDGVGAASWQASLASVAKRGMIVSFGNASGVVPSFSMRDLVSAGSIFVTRPTLFDYAATQEEMQRSADRLFQMIDSGAITINIGARFPLTEAAEAHRALEARETTGSTVLLP